MKWFDIDIQLNNNDKEWMFEIGNNIKEPSWTIRPYKLSDQEMNNISLITDQLPIRPEYAAIIMVPAGTMCKTHVDDRANANGVRQRITAINIPIKVHETSMFQYMTDMESNEIIETISLNTPKCWRVDIPHRVDNRLSPFNRVVLSLSFTQTVGEIYEIYTRT